MERLEDFISNLMRFYVCSMIAKQITFAIYQGFILVDAVTLQVNIN